MIKHLYFGFLLLVLLAQSLACSSDRAADQPEAYREAAVATMGWHQLLLDLERNTPGYRAPVTARMWAYVETAAWQAALPGVPSCMSLEKAFKGLPTPPVYSGAFSLPLSLNAVYAEILGQFFPTAPPYLLEKIQELEAENKRLFGHKTDLETANRSIAYAKTVALDIWRWSATDTYGHEAFLYNFDRNYSPPVGAGLWLPGGLHPTPALLPYWGKVRPFVIDFREIVVKEPIPYDDTPGSPFHAQAVEVLTMSKPLSNEHRWIAEFWSDDVPGLTVSPMGRWISITNQAIEKNDLPFPQVLEMYLKAAVCSADAVALCWYNKYKFNVERPESYIQRLVNPNWGPLHDSPQFPAYPSGHSALGSAVSEVLSAFLGNKFQLCDRTHEGRNEFSSKPRCYTSFQDMAQENALSRLALGVHYRMDCEEGLRLGRLVAEQVLSLPVRKQDARISLRK